MKWTTKDIDLYLQSKEYVDTLILPLIPVTWGNHLKQTVEAGEFATVITQEIERQFKGRVVLSPAFTYTDSEGTEAALTRLNTWSQDASLNGFRHVFLITTAQEWKSFESELKGSLISFPSLPLEHLDHQLRQSILQDQIKGLITIFMDKWRG
ncbi:YpiF family protein [Bacillus sp. PS06]|uniref:YpiF family protein n=1 Tax=Bacillus sp. PS06 TaxID=2764176 RepID=UPI0017847B78|nr:YpiF family protein [Bacillus sp. PS06]MBD8070236.1 YpiF family protein [Bacillus sp. PS06]